MKALELKEQLKEEYPFRIEMHAHSHPVSPCSEMTPAELAEIYGKSEIKYDAMVLANHYSKGLCDDLSKEEAIDRYLGAFSDFEEECKKFGITALLGCEIRFTENNNDYLIYGIDRDILSKAYDYFEKGLKAYRTEVILEKSVFLQAHPKRKGMTEINAELLDGIESFNMHPGHNSKVGIAAKYANENGLTIKTAGSDFHHPGQGHECVSALRTRFLPKDSFELAKILKSGDYLLEIGGDSLVLA